MKPLSVKIMYSCVYKCIYERWRFLQRPVCEIIEYMKAQNRKKHHQKQPTHTTRLQQKAHVLLIYFANEWVRLLYK